MDQAHLVSTLPTNRVYVANSLSDNVSIIDGLTNQAINTLAGVDAPGGIGLNHLTNRIYVTDTLAGNVIVILDEIIGPTPTPTPRPTLPPMPTPVPTPTPPKRFTFECDQGMGKGYAGLERFTIRRGEDAHCILRLTDIAPTVSVDVATRMGMGLNHAVRIDPATGVTDVNGELQFTITGIKKGIDWVAWAVPNEEGAFDFSKEAYDNGIAWGMFIVVE